ncbi:HAD hydrolase-like protein, partial [Patescibacteria group bacterium]|nr:HAD hydrolase-like protein [Patescibacteria group bacterium]
MGFESVIFDFDGVLVNSNKIKKQACFYIFKGIKGAEKAVQEILDNLGGDDRYQFIRRVLQKLQCNSSESEVQKYAKLYGQITEKGQIEAKEIKGATECLKALRKMGYRLFLHTSTPDQAIKRVAKQRGIDVYFDEIYGSTRGNKTEVLQIIIKENNLSPEKILSIGDGNSKFEAAKELGIEFIGLANESNDFSKRSDLKYVLYNDLTKLLDIVETKGEYSKNPTTWATDSPVSVGWMRQFRYFLRLYNIYKDITGDIVECGVGAGDTFAMLAYFMGSETLTKRTLWGFDSFKGWPEPTQWDASPRNPKKGDWLVNKDVTLERLEKSGIFRQFLNPDLKIKIIKGFFDKTLPQFPNRPIAFLHIDADLYRGYCDALVNLFPKVAIGGVIAFDEYQRYPNRLEYDNGTIEKWPGCTKAVDEYFSERPEQIMHYSEASWYPKYYV